MLELYMVRHGQTELSRENRFCGRIDPPLNDNGRLMAEALGRAFASLAWDAIYVSPRQRARETAAPLLSRLGASPVLAEGLAEIGYGDWEGMTPDEARAHSPDIFARWSEPNFGGTAPPGGESAFEVAARAVRVMDELRVAHPSGRVLIVSHKGTLRILLCALLGIDVRLF